MVSWHTVAVAGSIFINDAPLDHIAGDGQGNGIASGIHEHTGQDELLAKLMTHHYRKVVPAVKLSIGDDLNVTHNLQFSKNRFIHKIEQNSSK